MRIIYELESYTFGPHGGVVRMFDETIGHLAQQPDYQALFYAPAKVHRFPPESPRARRCLWRGLPPSLRKPLPLKLHQVAGRIYWKCHPADLFHPTFYPEHLNPELRRLPSIVNIYDLTHEKIPHADDMPDHGRFLWRKKKSIERAERLICISEATRADLLEHYQVNQNNVRVVHLACSDTFQPIPEDERGNRLSGLPVSTDRPFILYVGARQRYKNYHRFIQAYRAWPGASDVDVLVVGGPRTAGDAMIDDMTGDTGRIIYTGHMDDTQLNALYAAAEFFVYPSLSEGFGIPLLEAMASDCPVCASDIPVFREIAGDAVTYFDPFSIDAMVAAFDGCRASRSDAGLSECRQARTKSFSWTTCAEKIWNVYRELA